MPIPRISRSEFAVMDAVWSLESDGQPASASDIIARLQDRDWTAKTIRSMLSRLVAKGALSTQADGRRYLYSTCASREQVEASAVRSLSDRLFGGRAAPLLSYLAEGEGLRDDDIAEIEALIRKLKS